MPTWLHIRPKPLIIAGAIALVASLLGAFLASDAQQIGWHIGTIASALAITLLLGLIPPKGLPTARIVFVALVSIGAVIIGVSYFQNLTSWTWATGSLASLGNRNSVGAGVALAGFATFLMFPRLRIVSAPVYLAILFVIGGRTPLIALFAGVVIVAGYAVFKRLPKPWWVPSIIAIGAVVAIAITAPPKLHAWLTAYEAASKNQLANFTEKHVATWAAAPTEATWLGNTAAGPAASLSTTETNSVLSTHVLAEVPANYAIAAGVTMRANTPATITLTAGSAIATCHVTTEWATCETEPVVTETDGDIPWQLTSNEPVTVEITAPFARVYEPGWLMDRECNSDCAKTIRTIKSTLKRFDVLGWGTDRNVTSRLEGQQFALQQFLQKPLAGWGLNQLKPTFKAAYPEQSGIDHAHNAIIDIMFERGLLGMLAVGALLVGVIRAVRPRTTDLVFFLIFVVILQAADSTWYFNLVYYPFWVALSLLRNPTAFSRGSAAPADQTPA